METLLKWCVSLNNPFVYALLIVVIPSLIWNVKAFIAFTKKYAIKLWVVEEKLQDAGIDIAEDAPVSGGMSSKWQWAAVLVILGLIVTLVAFSIIWRG